MQKQAKDTDNCVKNTEHNIEENNMRNAYNKLDN
jgi:hypothetical protein